MIVGVAVCGEEKEGPHLDNKTHNQFNEILDRIIDVTSELEDIGREPLCDATRTAACREAVQRLVADYRGILAQVPADEQKGVEQRVGRRVIGLRRKADETLPAGPTRGNRVPVAQDTQWGPSGISSVASESTPNQASAPQPRPKPRPKGPAAGREIESWCGPCKASQTHTIIAMVGDKPKQVLCESCGARHGYRKPPVEKRAVPLTKRRDRAQERKNAEKERIEAELAVLHKELDEATEVSPFEKRRRYRVGQIIDHPEHGRGKVEYSTRGSVLVRFRDRRRPIDTD